MMMDFKGNTKKILFLWVATSLILGVIAYPLTFLMPLNKRLWSISFVFLTSAITGLSLAFVTFFIDVLGKRYAKYGKIINKITTPFLWLGMNSLAIYVLNFLRNCLDNSCGSVIQEKNIYQVMR
jgi:predicted acyltransferase